MSTFREFGKISRLNREIVITEKIDGTNSAILVENLESQDAACGGLDTTPGITISNGRIVRVQSRNRFISPESDNFGFARWVYSNAEALADLLGYGLHFGEWWGAGVQRTYGVKEKRFSLFNTNKWKDLNEVIGKVPVKPVPVLYTGPWTVTEYDPCSGGYSGYYTWAPDDALISLRKNGSVAEPGFMDPEGIVVFHTASSTLFKATCKNDEKPKGSKE